MAPAVVTLLRSPRAHVLSQWEECRYSEFGRNTSKLHPEFRERFESGTDAEGFDAWLSSRVRAVASRFSHTYSLTRRSTAKRLSSC